MPSRDWKFRIEDILAAIDAGRDYTAGMDLDEFIRERRTVDAVVRNLIIIGEAAGHVPEEVRKRTPEVPWVDMRAMRNFIVHEYFGVSGKIIWDTVQDDLPAIVDPLRRLLASEDD